MKKIFQYFRTHLKEDFNTGYYLTIIIFLALCLVYNYSFHFDDKVIDRYHGTNKGFFLSMLYYSVPYYFAYLAYVIFYKKGKLLRDYRIWGKSLLFISFFALDASHALHHKIIYNWGVFPQAKYFDIRCMNNLSSFYAIFLPLLLYYLFFEKQKESFYGLAFKHVNLRPYFILLLLMVPVVIAASFGKDFSTYYPRYPQNTSNYFNIPHNLAVVVFELCYSWDFLSTELFFRGALVLGMSALLGKGAIMPMVSIYVFIHFGKPAGEAVSSFFGGYILGVIAYYTRNIWGGVCIHIGIALMMEIAAFLQR